MYTLNVLFFLIFSYFTSIAQTRTNLPQSRNIARPKLVVGIVVDQMRWDLLYRYNDRYLTNGGFKRILQQGFTCENTFIPYTPTVTACGHTCIYTGSVPAIHGITGNAWWDNKQNKIVYCTDDKTVKTTGSNTNLGQMSPANMLATTICDELRLATNFRSKVIGIALKDRGGILPAGHSANAAYWYDNTIGNWISSSYYMNELPQWVSAFNEKKLVDKYYQQGWDLMYPAKTYLQSSSDEKTFEGRPFGAEVQKFPYDLKKFAGKNYNPIAQTPYGNSLTIEFAKATINAEQLGADSVTDFLAISFSSTDYVGHAFGPNSIEIEDTYLRLDRELGELFNLLDSKIGKGQWLAFLSADHGVAHVPGYLKENKIPAGSVDDAGIASKMNAGLKSAFGPDKIVVSSYNYQIHLNDHVIDSAKLDSDKIKAWILRFLQDEESVAQAFLIEELMKIPLPEKLRNMFANGYFPSRSGDIQIILKPGWIDGGPAGTTHGLWNPYDSHIPLVWYGWNIKPGRTHREVSMADIAPTLAALLHIQMPSGCVGKVIEEITR